VGLRVVQTVSEIPTRSGQNFKERVSLNGIEYTLVFKWNPASNCWILDIYDTSGLIPLLRGAPLITGADLLSQYAYLEISGKLIVVTIAVGHSPDEVPTFQNLGSDGHLFYITET
jgi:hypothetical protein